MAAEAAAAGTASPGSPPPSRTGACSVKNYDRDERLKELKSRRKRERILQRSVPVLLVAPWFLGIAWTSMHPLVSVVTGELKCRGQYIDENGLDVHRHRVRAYPLERTAAWQRPRRSGDGTRGDGADPTGMCGAIRSARPGGVSPSVECLRHMATDTLGFDVARVLPPMGPMIDATEAVALVVGEHGGGKDEGRGWYERSDLNASIMNLIKKLGNRKDCPWLTKAVFIVSPSRLKTMSTANGYANSSINTESISPLGSTVDAFVASYLGHDPNISPLPPHFTFHMMRSVLVLNDVEKDLSSADVHRTEVRILPQGLGGVLPNLDLVFATFMSLQSHQAGNRHDHSQSIYYGDSEFRAHPFGSGLEESVGQVLGQVGSILGLKESAVQGYANDFAGLLGFTAGLVIGSRQPHASALDHGIDGLTIEVRIHKGDAPASSIHPHYADLTRCVEHLLRSISNLHERLHHSIAQYTMPSPSKFVSHGEYIYPAILVSLPMIVRAATLALRDLNRFRFLYTGMVVGSVCISTAFVSLWSASTHGAEKLEDFGLEWISPRTVHFISYLFVVFVARWNKVKEDTDECHGSLRFIGCLLGIYLHAPMLLSNYSLGFPSSAFWTPLLATLVLPLPLEGYITRNTAFLALSAAARCLFILATSPPVFLVPRIFPGYTLYVLCVYTPLHLLLAALWLA